MARRCDGQRLRVGGRARCLVQGQARGGGRVRVVTVATRTRVCRRIRAWRCAAVQFWAGSGPPSPVQRGPGRGRAMPRCSMHVAYLRGLEVRMLQPKSSSFSFRRGSRGKESSGGEKKRGNQTGGVVLLSAGTAGGTRATKARYIRRDEEASSGVAGRAIRRGTGLLLITW